MKQESKKVSLWELFWAFAKIGTFTIGGGYMMIPAIQDELSRRRWISDEELPDIVAIAQSAPGLLTVNMSIFAGYRLRGIPGSIAATIGSIFSPIIFILLIAIFFRTFSDNALVVRIFSGVRPAAVAVMFAFTLKLARTNGRCWWKWLLSGLSVVLIAILDVSPIYAILVTLAGALAVSMWKEKKQ